MGNILQLPARPAPERATVRCSFCSIAASKVAMIIQSEETKAAICTHCLAKAVAGALARLGNPGRPQ